MLKVFLYCVFCCGFIFYVVFEIFGLYGCYFGQVSLVKENVKEIKVFSMCFVLANDGTMVWWHSHSLGGLCQTFRVLQQSFELTDSHWVTNFYWTKARRSLPVMVLILKVGCSWPELMFAFCASLRSVGNLKMWNQSGHNSKSTGLSNNIQTTPVQWRRSS